MINAHAASLRLVALGGGTGLPVVLRGCKNLLYASGPADHSRLTAVVTVTDDGGSSGRLVNELGVLPPGDIRNCLVALSHNRPLVARVFQARYQGGETLEGHSCGNLILAALMQEEGSFLGAIRVASDVLQVRGRVLPLTLEPVKLVARLAGGETVEGECAIAGATGQIEHLGLDQHDIPPTPGVVEAIERADIVTFGPGSLFSSIMPNLLIPEVVDALRRSRAFKVLLVNAMTEQGETGDFSAADHVRAIHEHTGGAILDAAILARDEIPERLLARYSDEGARRVEPDDGEIDALVPTVLRENLLEAGPKVRHDALLCARAIVRCHARWLETKHEAVSSDLPRREGRP